MVIAHSGFGFGTNGSSGFLISSGNETAANLELFAFPKC